MLLYPEAQDLNPLTLLISDFGIPEMGKCPGSESGSKGQFLIEKQMSKIS